MIGCDMVVAAGAEAQSKMQAGRTRLVVNNAEVPTAEFTRKRDWLFPGADMHAELEAAVGTSNADFVDATRLATALIGDAIATNPFMLGFAYQKGLVPVSAAAIERAIELNGVAVEANRKAFLWGRRAAHDPRAGGEGGDAGGSDPDRAALLALARRDDRPPRRVPHRLPGRRVRRALPCARRPRAPGRGRPRSWHEARRGGRALLLQADGVQGRVRGGAAVHAARVHAAAAGNVRRATIRSSSTSRRRSSPSPIR